MEQDSIALTALDQMVGSDYEQMMKAALPYLPPDSRKILSVYAKTRELLNTLALFSGSGQGVEMCAAEASDPMDMLQDIRRFCYGGSRRMLDKAVNMMAVVQMMQIMGQSADKKEE